MSKQDWLIQARGVSIKLGGRWVLENVDLQVSRGEIVTLVGLNGSGKSTLVRTLLGLISPDRGTVIRAPELRVGYSPQDFQRDRTLPMTVYRFLALSADAARSRIQAVLEDVGAPAVLDNQVADISGGELHRVLLARALLRQPDLLVLDEPLAGVDVSSQSELYRVIARVRDDYRCGVLLVSHELHVVMAATDTVVCLNRHVCCQGHPRSVAKDPQFVALFGRQVAETLAVYTHQHDHRHEVTGETVPMDDVAQESRVGS